MMAERADKKAERQREAPSLSDQLAAIEIDSRSAYDLEEWREAA
jgi:hypothetical protein